ncbi:MAG: sigma-54-dependent Fis family transcriptional regulator [Planctomycetota bacterium]|nr:MAG: sigma-54-dependent Fis family transcriptional regulator [Planctomycetota bacterium]
MSSTGSTPPSTTPDSQPGLGQLAVLVVDDEADIRLGLRRLLAGLGIEAREAESGLAALQLLDQQDADLVITDLMMPGLTGVELLAAVKRRRPETKVVLLTGFGTVQTAVQCLQAGASHFLTKPFDNNEILGLVRRLGLQILAQRATDGAHDPSAHMLAVDPSMQRVLELVARVAPSPLPVLVEGESGTGKELVARAVHAASAVAAKPFQAVNCAALADTLLESELFGHRRGAFTGADRDRRGLFQEADGGTVFLDEVSSMSPAFQGKLLRVLQEKLVRPVGGSRDESVSFRLVAATNRDLEAMVSEGSFREDLYYRLQVVRVCVPPLRKRPGDVLPLAHLFLRRVAAECLGPDARAPELGVEAAAALQRHGWPGNVRQLENAIQRAVVVCSGERILPYHLGLESGWSAPAQGGLGAPAAQADYADAKQAAIEQFQREFVQRALECSEGNVSQAAAACGMTRVALQKILRQLHIDRADFADGGGPTNGEAR